MSRALALGFLVVPFLILLTIAIPAWPMAFLWLVWAFETRGLMIEDSNKW